MSGSPRKAGLVVMVGIPLAAAGCTAAMFRPLSTVPSPNYASLYFSIEKGEQAAVYDGILSVDGEDVPEELRQRAYVAQGLRRIGYECPGWITVDGPSTIDHRFEAGRHYQLVCESKPARIVGIPAPR